MSFFRLIFFSLLFLINTSVFSQGDSCVNSTFFCSDASYTYTSLDNTTAEAGPNYGCLLSQPNINWLHFQISQPGDLELTISSSLGYDLDFICWGPFSDISTACYPVGTGVDCSYSTDASEICTVQGTQVGEYYLLAITNYSNQASDITIVRTGGTAYAACAGVSGCYGTFSNVTTSSCDTTDNTHLVIGDFLPLNPPTTGSLYISNSLGDTIGTYSAPFPNTIPFMYSANSDGGTVIITSSFTDSLQCTSSYNYNAPSFCGCNMTGYNYNISASSSSDSCVSNCVGTASVLANGGVTPYSYQWSDTGSQTTDTATNLCAGLYSVSVTDSNGCILIGNVQVTDSQTPDYYISDNQTIFLGDSVQICVYDSANVVVVSYLWQTGDQTACTTVSPVDTTIYNVLIELCGTTVTDSVIVMVDFSQGINLYSSEKEIVISPNPAKNQIKVIGIDKAVGYQIFDINGKVVQKGKTNENISFNLPKGVYLIDLKGYNPKKLVVRK